MLRITATKTKDNVYTSILILILFLYNLLDKTNRVQLEYTLFEYTDIYRHNYTDSQDLTVQSVAISILNFAQYIFPLTSMLIWYFL